MKVIELLNKIANGENIKKVKYQNHIYEYYNGDYREYFDGDYDSIWLFASEIIDLSKLNDEIEIIEEPKKIEKLDLIIDEHFTNDELQAYIYETQVKINEIIDYINEDK